MKKLSQTELKRDQRSKRGAAALAEFGPAVIAFILFGFFPLLDYGVVLIRYGIGYGVQNALTHRMGLAEKISNADSMLNNDNGWRTQLKKCGVKVKLTDLRLKVVNKSNLETQVLIPEPSPVPAQWQPDSIGGPFIYYLELQTNLDIDPLFPMTSPWKAVPGLTGPMTIAITTDAAWENLGRDSESLSEEFYLNE